MQLIDAAVEVAAVVEVALDEVSGPADGIAVGAGRLRHGDHGSPTFVALPVGLVLRE